MGIQTEKTDTANGEKKLFIETYGCQMNAADSEVVASIMKMEGYTLCDNLEDADAIFINTCSRPLQGAKPRGADDRRLPRAQPGARGGGEIKAGYLTRCP